MATFSTHILSSLDGTHLSGVIVSLVEVSKEGKRQTLFKKKTDSGGRMSTEFSPNVGENFDYEVIISASNSFKNLDQQGESVKNIKVSYFSVGVKFENIDSTYHMPFILSPYGFSGWISR